MDQENHGHALLLRDLLKLRTTFRYSRYRVDVLGFVAAWLFVISFIVFYWWLSKWR